MAMKVDTKTLKTKANELKSLNAKLKAQIQSLSSAENALNGMWDGDANDAFHKAFAKDIVQMNNFYNAVEKYVTTLNEVAKQYETIEAKNATRGATRTYNR